MAEVINLLSSSPVSRSGSIFFDKDGEANKQALQDGKPSGLYSLDLDVPAILATEIERPLKRRKVSPRNISRTSQRSKGTRDDCIFELSSEPDVRASVDRSPLPSKPLESLLNVTEDDAGIPPFSSSAPELSSFKNAQDIEVIDILSDDDPLDNDPILSSSQPNNQSRPVFSALTANLLAGLNNKERSKPNCIADATSKRTLKSYAKESKPARPQRQASDLIDNIIDSSQPEVSVHAWRERIDKSVGQAVSRASKDTNREAQKALKRLEKERKQQEKQKAAEIAEVNKSKTNRKNAAAEMFVELPNWLKGTELGIQVEELANQLDIETTYVSEEIDLINGETPSSGNIVKWRRRVTATYDEDQELWNPLERPQISMENHILVHLTAEAFCASAVVNLSEIATESSASSHDALKHNLDSHVAKLRKQYPNCTIIYLIQGLTAFLKKGQNAKNRAYTAAVRSQALENVEEPSLDAPSQRTTSRRRKASVAPKLDLSRITSDVAEELLLHLQLMHQPLLIHHTTSIHTSAAQIHSFTQHLATRPYRLTQQSHNIASSSFCMDTGQIRTSSDPKETFISMLQEINRVTPSMAHGIAGTGYDSVRKLVHGFRDEGNLMLEDVRKATNKDGGWSDRRLGPMVSKRLYKVFMGRDPGQMDGIA